MFSIGAQVTIAGVTEARRDLPGLLERVSRGESVVLQKNSEPVGVLIGYELYQKLVGQAEGREPPAPAAANARQREERIAQGKDKLVTLESMLNQLSNEATHAD